MRYLETGEPTESELSGNYDNNLLNKVVRDNKEVVINNKQLNDKLQMVFELSTYQFGNIIYKKWKESKY